MNSMDEIKPRNRELLPPEMLLDATHPDNDSYMKSLDLTRMKLVAQSRKFKPKHLIVIKAHFHGDKSVHISKQVGLTPATVNKIIHTPEAQTLLTLLAHHQAAIEGPNEAQRKAMLWRIAMDNQQIMPRVAIAAIDTLNKMNGTYTDPAQSGLTINGPAQVVVLMNTELLPQGKLD